MFILYTVNHLPEAIIIVCVIGNVINKVEILCNNKKRQDCYYDIVSPATLV